MKEYTVYVKDVQAFTVKAKDREEAEEKVIQGLEDNTLEWNFENIFEYEVE